MEHPPRRTASRSAMGRCATRPGKSSSGFACPNALTISRRLFWASAAPALRFSTFRRVGTCPGLKDRSTMAQAMAWQHHTSRGSNSPVPRGGCLSRWPRRPVVGTLRSSSELPPMSPPLRGVYLFAHRCTFRRHRNSDRADVKFSTVAPGPFCEYLVGMGSKKPSPTENGGKISSKINNLNEIGELRAAVAEIQQSLVKICQLSYPCLLDLRLRAQCDWDASSVRGHLTSPNLV
jgi:hypothetical protein